MNLVGKTFDRLTVINDTGKRSKSNIIWMCKCTCGSNKEVLGTNLNRKYTRSCGCLKREKDTVHGDSPRGNRTPEYITYRSMLQRCYNPKSISYKYYGKRGITICKRWLNSFTNFLIDMGRKPEKSYSIDRINNKGNYEPSNCRWATKLQQTQNRSL